MFVHELIFVLRFLAFSTVVSGLSYERRQNLPISTSGSCGVVDGVETTCLGSVEGNCCSYLGYCGGNSSYCGAGCQSDYGLCGNSKISTDGSCGGDAGLTCLGASMGNCCSQRGYCGDTANHCGSGCRSDFGDCYQTSNTNTSSTSSIQSNSAQTQTSSIGSESAKATPNVQPLTQTAGFKAGMGVLGVVLGLSLGFLVFWLVRRRRGGTPVAVSAEAHDDPTEIIDVKELGNQEIHELSSENAVQELPATRSLSFERKSYLDPPIQESTRL